MGGSNNVLEGGEDAMTMAFVGMFEEFLVLRLDQKSCLVNELLVSGLKPPHDTFCPCVSVVCRMGVVVDNCCIFDAED